MNATKMKNHLPAKIETEHRQLIGTSKLILLATPLVRGSHTHTVLIVVIETSAKSVLLSVSANVNEGWISTFVSVGKCWWYEERVSTRILQILG